MGSKIHAPAQLRRGVFKDKGDICYCSHGTVPRGVSIAERVNGDGVDSNDILQYEDYYFTSEEDECLR